MSKLLKIFEKGTVTVSYKLESAAEETWDAKNKSDPGITATTDGYTITLVVMSDTAQTASSNEKMSYAVGCIIAADYKNALCSHGGQQKKDGSDPTVKYGFFYSEDEALLEKAADGGEVDFVSDTYNYTEEMMKITRESSQDLKEFTSVNYQPTSADSYTENYRFGGGDGIKVRGAYGTKADQAKF